MLNRFYQKQQLIMTQLGFYDGVCDGVWGPKCVAAKREWEYDDRFEPAVPSNGLPFTGRGKLPRGMNYMHKGLDIMWDAWDQAAADTLLAGEKGQMLTAQHVRDHVMNAEQKQQQDVTVEQQPQARGQQKSEPQVSTLKPFEHQAEEVEEEDESEKTITDSVKSDDADNKPAATTQQPERNRDWLQGKKRS